MSDTRVPGLQMASPSSASRRSPARESHGDPDIIITHDFLETYGGAERVTQEMAAEFPRASVVSILGRPAVAKRMGVGERWRPLLPSRPVLLRHYRELTPALPAIVGAGRLSSADVLLSSSYAFAHHFRTRNAAPQLCYCHSPLRFAWTMTDEYEERWARGGPLSAVAFRALAAGVRHSDKRAADRVDHFCTQSPYTAQQIQQFYGQTADVIGAPVDCELFHPPDSPDPDDYVLLCGRLIEPYKKMGVALDALRRLGRRVVVAGDGPALPELRRLAGPDVTFLGHLRDAPLVEVMQRASFLLFPSRDDFGLIPVEAMACGRPVLAYSGGGARYTVLPGATGELFREQTSDCIAEAVSTFDPDRYEPDLIRRHAEQWDRHLFRSRLRKAVLEIAR